MADTEKVFARGFVLKAPRAGAPDFVLGSISIKTDEAIQFLNEHTKNTGWLNLTMKKSAGGKLYLELDTWTPPTPGEQKAIAKERETDNMHNQQVEYETQAPSINIVNDIQYPDARNDGYTPPPTRQF